MAIRRSGIRVKVKVGFLYSTTYAAMPRPATLYNRRSGSWLA